MEKNYLNIHRGKNTHTHTQQKKNIQINYFILLFGEWYRELIIRVSNKIHIKKIFI